MSLSEMKSCWPRVATVIREPFTTMPRLLVLVSKCSEFANFDSPVSDQRSVSEDRLDYAPYLKHWSQEDRELTSLMKNPDIRPGEQSMREYNLVRDFANRIDDILAFLQDVLMPRQFEAHLEGDFEALRQALKRRLGP